MNSGTQLLVPYLFPHTKHILIKTIRAKVFEYMMVAMGIIHKERDKDVN